MDYKNQEVRPLGHLHYIVKRSIDIAGGITGLIIFLPIFVILPLFYLRGKNKGPVFFKQPRIGKNGKVFYIYKFRSMIMNAEEKLKENKILYHKYIKNNYKLEQYEDPRVTIFGRFLRKTSLDELPQFINVLKGDMSLVGPRPVIKEELKEYGELTDKFLSVKPGLTGYWQVSGRSDVGYPKRVHLELHYVYNQSIYFDLKILILTIVHVLLRKGAY
ncbi:sugar transferase [Gottfriedia acidiceleris]|uniref:sugar transferase n=1 Tax=Gottfriedia acidiceleris TaxID=371036 RepID=UPI00300089E6